MPDTQTPDMPALQLFKFTDDIMFKCVIDDVEICRGIIERLIGRPVEDVKRQNTEQEVRTGPTAKYIRTDTYLVESNGTLYDVEMQLGSARMLPKRFRGYQSVIDNTVLWRGKDYDSLKESYIVFICTKDHFKKGLPVYHIERACREDSGVKFECGAHWMIVNASAYDAVEGDEPLRSLLRYIQTEETTEGDELVARIAAEVAHNNGDKDWRKRMLSPIETVKQEARVQARIEVGDEARAEGLAEGRAEGRAEGEERLSKLIETLMGQGRIDDIRAASSDPEKRRELYSEFGL